MKTGKVIIVSVLCMAITIGICYAMLHREFKKIAVIDAVRLFNEYQMKKEIEEKETGRLKYFGHIADSVRQSMELAQKMNAAREAQKSLVQAFRMAKMELDQNYEQSNQMINEQVWKRLNPLIDEYAKEHGYKLIIGANGMGSVLYNDSYYDITDQVLKSINKQYAQGN